MLLWLEGAPKFGIDDDEEVTEYIDKIITCYKLADDNQLLNLLNR